ncbi:MAG: XdhC family protein [Gammaproteobacteria bacterium]|nr:xanthine dehydrogenase [Gammaproteobacteria bacterium]
MNPTGQSLDEFFAAHVRIGAPLALATVVSTTGSTYRKAGAQMLIAADGSSAGLLSGGCLETDLLERARSVIESGDAMLVEYDSRGPDDIIWGIGLGCEGTMRILLSRLDPANAYEPYAFAARCRAADRAGAIAFVTATDDPELPLGHAFTTEDSAHAPPGLRSELERLASSDSASAHLDTASASFLLMRVPLPLRLLVLGAGPDAMPLVDFAGLLGWHVTVLDHRAAYAVPERFPRARKVAVRPASELVAELCESRYDAAVVMSHHLPSDAHYLRALASSDVPYIGLLGPAARRARLMSELGASARNLEGRLYGPVGLDIGANTPESIALAIAAEIHAVRSGRRGGPCSATKT